MRSKKLLPHTLIFSFDLLIIFVIICTVFYLYQENNKITQDLSQQKYQTLKDSSKEKHKEMSLPIKEQVMHYLRIPRSINKENNFATIEYVEDIGIHREYFEKKFASQLMNNPTINQIYFGNKKGEFIDAIRKKDEIYIAYKASPKNLPQYYLWNNQQKKRSEEKTLFSSSFSRLPADYDPRNRPWYKEGKERWSGIYDDHHSRELVISAIYPVEGKGLLGVFGCEFLFTNTNKKLKSIKKSIKMLPKETIFFLTDNKDRNLLSTTTEDKISYVDGDDTKPVKLKNTGNSLLRRIAEKMEEMPQETLYDFFYKIGYLIQILPINDDFGLDWSLVVITPKEPFMEQGNKHNNEMLQIISLAMFIALVMWLTSILLKRKYLGKRS